ncbi:extracellular solute-binding protein [Streptomyces sp. OUCMDZ-4982]|uniref:ABC transporter substrate-binding protein n=1 Tax=Streptomyces sp. OUCMDZ-4982 TaxID=2973090 RepID=UPI00215C16E6|nr:extracellular solute-binding protein [Streptomyces sp. OUCMDZ-4982]MCR8943172.1 extracellular solute-binding protein [Streptomyces sp. OUCMDZ-4982]
MSVHRRKFWPALIVTGALTLGTACAGGDSAADDGSVTVEFRWWGSDERHQLTQKAVDAFEAKHENIKVKVQTFDWNSYYDQLTTTMAAGDAPDVFAVEIRRLGELGRAGQLADVGKLVDTSDLNAQLLRSGEVDGVLRAVPTGANTFSLMANTKVLDDVGVELPDDSTWSWDDYHALAAEVSGKTGRGVYGTQINFNDAFLQVFAAQHGQSLYEGGKLGVTADTVADWYGTHMDLLGKGAPPADLSSEIDATGVEQSLIATGKGAMGMWWSNQLGVLTSGSGANVEMLRMPRSAGARTNGMFLQPTMHWAVAERSDAKEAAAKLVDFLVNDPEAGAILGSDRGLPMNSKVLADVRDGLPETDQKSLAFIEANSKDLTAPRAYPDGAGEIPAMLQRYGEEVIFGRLTAQKAAEAFVKEANGALH